MPAFGNTAFEPLLNANDLFIVAQRVDDPEVSEDLIGFAHDMAVLSALPVIIDGVPTAELA